MHTRQYSFFPFSLQTLLIAGRKLYFILDQNVRQAWAAVLLLEGVCSVLGWAAHCSGAGTVVVYLQCFLCLLARAGAGGLCRVCWYFPVAMQKVVLCVKKKELVQCFALTLLLLPVSDQALRNSTSISACTVWHPRDTPVLTWDLVKCHGTKVYALRLLA